MKNRRRLALLGAALLLGSAPWVTGSPILVLYPKDVPGTLTMTDATGAPVQLVSYEIHAVEQGLPWASSNISSRTFSPAGPPHPWSMTLDGGDPEAEDNPGHGYKFGVLAYLENTINKYTYLRFRVEQPISVVNGQPQQPVALVGSGLRHIEAHVEVANGHLEYARFYAQVSIAGNDHYAQTYERFLAPAQVASATQTILQFPAARVRVWGAAQVLDESGNRSVHSLGNSYHDLTAQDGELSWTIDAAPPNGFDGAVSVASNASGATPSHHHVYFSGRGSLNGFTLYKPVPASGGIYSARLPVGEYEAFVRTYFSVTGLLYSSDTPVVVASSSSTVLPLDFSISLKQISLPFIIGGFYSNESVTRASGVLSRMSLNGAMLALSGAMTQLQNGLFSFPVTPGRWKPYEIEVAISRGAPENSTNTVRWLPQNDPALPLVDLPLEGPSQYLYSPRQLTLVDSRIYLDVREDFFDDPQTLLGNPSAQLDKQTTNSNGVQLGLVRVSANRTQSSSSMASLNLVAEPGTYTLDAKARVNGAAVAFPRSTIVFGVPETVPEAAQTTEWTPDAQPDLRVKLDFGAPTAGGTSSVVKTTQGPTPPEGFATLCTPNQDDPDSCPTIYYDIRTNIPPVGHKVEVCVRQAYDAIVDLNGNGNADEVAHLAAALTLFHFKEGTACDPHLPPDDGGSCWESLDELPLHSGNPLVMDCSTNLAACGCQTSLECGISTGVTVLQVCGLTSSFSPFTVLRESGARFSATGTGATGALQSWTAPSAGVYRITAVGAKGGAASGDAQAPSGLSGGCGAELDGEFALARGDTLQLLVGHKGLSTSLNGGGGGGSFVVRNGAPLLVAGGGGGVRSASTVNGRDASLTNNGVAGSTSPSYSGSYVAGGTAGRGGNRAAGYGAGGGGWSGNGAADGVNGNGGFAFLATGANAGRGGAGLKCDGPPFADGGFGGGGAGNGCHGGGGGGGYSGGGAGRVAGGGGSWNVGANPHAKIQCSPDGNGRVRIERVRD